MYLSIFDDDIEMFLLLTKNIWTDRRSSKLDDITGLHKRWISFAYASAVNLKSSLKQIPWDLIFVPRFRSAINPLLSQSSYFHHRPMWSPRVHDLPGTWEMKEIKFLNAYLLLSNLNIYYFLDLFLQLLWARVCRGGKNRCLCYWDQESHASIPIRETERMRRDCASTERS